MTDHQKINNTMFRLCQERLLPSLVTSMIDRLKVNTKRDYKRIIFNRYKEELKLPRKYNPQQGLNNRDLFQIKLNKIKNHQIPIDYCRTILNQQGKKVPSYNNNALDTVRVETQQQFKVFKYFNYDNFHNKEKFNSVWDEHVEQQPQSPIYNPYIIHRSNQKRKRLNTVPDLIRSGQQQIVVNNPIQQQKSPRRLRYKSQTLKSSNKLEISSPRLKALSKSKKSMTSNESYEIAQKFRIIGGFLKLPQNDKQSITKESIVRYLMKFITKPQRIIDFLEIKSVETLESYILLVKRIKNMPKKHINFMCFLFLDQNNDALICDNDIFNLLVLSKSSKYVRCLESDYQKLTKTRQYKRHLMSNQSDLYRLPEISQSCYFNFLQTQQNKQSNLEQKSPEQINSPLFPFNKKKKLDFACFQKIYRNDKPGIWYFLIEILGGIRYEGIQYDK